MVDYAALGDHKGDDGRLGVPAMSFRRRHHAENLQTNIEVFLRLSNDIWDRSTIKTCSARRGLLGRPS